MRLLTICITILFLLSGLVFTASAKEDKQHSGVETSAEHKSEQGLEHGEAYAGSKEKKVKDKDADEDDEEEDEEDNKQKGKKSK